MEKIPLKRDDRWSAFATDHTWESFQEMYLPKFDLSPSVNEEAKKRYRVIRKLIAFSYYEYEFFDIAASQMAMLMEMAMVLRYQEITGEEWSKNKVKKGEPKRDLKNLFSWLGEQGYLELTHHFSKDLLRQTRNYFAHPKKHSFGGGMNLPRIKELLFLINALYDPYLKERNKLQLEFIEWMKVGDSFKMLMLRLEDRLIPLVGLDVIFIDCSLDVIEYHLVCYPCIDLGKINKNSPYSHQTMFLLKLSNIKTDLRSIAGSDILSGNKIEIEQADDGIRQVIIDWHKQLQELPEVAAQMDMWRTTAILPIIEELRTSYYNKLHN